MGHRWRAVFLFVALLLVLAQPPAASAHGPGEGDSVGSAWNLDPLIVMPLALSGWLYGRGVQALWRRAGPDRGVRRWQVAAFYGGIATLVVALVSPVEHIAGEIFAMHMVQHILLIMVAAPLLSLGAPNLAFLWALPTRRRRQMGQWWKGSGLRPVWRTLTHPMVAWWLHTLALWLWHIPALYEAALASEAVHALEHASFLGTALLFWWVLWQVGPNRRLGYGAALFYIFSTMIQGSILGALMTFSPVAWYAAHAAGAAAWGLTPLEDQQLAGLIMWVPAGPIYLLAFLLLLRGWMQAAGRAVQRQEEGWRLAPERGTGG